MDIIYILIGAVLTMVGFIECDGTTQLVVGWSGLAVLFFGLVVNHRRHTSR